MNIFFARGIQRGKAPPNVNLGVDTLISRKVLEIES